MIQKPIYVREEFLDKVKTFCSLNNIEWGTVYSESWLDWVHGTPEEIGIVEKYIRELNG